MILILVSIYFHSTWLPSFDAILFCNKAWLSCTKELQSDPINSDTLDFWINCENFLRSAKSNTISYKAPIDMNSKNIKLQNTNEIKTIHTTKSQDRILRLCCINYVFAEMALWKDDDLVGETNNMMFNIDNGEKDSTFSLFRGRDKKFTKFIKNQSTLLYENIEKLSDLQMNCDNSNIKNGGIAPITTIIGALHQDLVFDYGNKLQKFQLLKEKGEINTICMFPFFDFNFFFFGHSVKYTIK